MKDKGILIVLILVTLAGNAWAQKLSLTDRLGGTYVVTFNTGYGDVKVFLPDDMAGGDTVSAAIFSYPRGTTQAEKTGNSGVLGSYRIHTDMESVSVRDGSITINIPKNMSGSSLRVTLRDEGNRGIGYSSAQVKLRSSYAERPETPSPFDFETPLIGQSGRLIEIKGPFDGDFSTTELTLGARPAHLVSESPGKLVFEAPSDISGSAEIVLNENGVVVKRPFTSLRVVKIGEESSSPLGSVVPEGYAVSVPQAVAPREPEPTVRITQETLSEEAAPPEPGTLEQELELESVEVQEETPIETDTPPGAGSVNTEIALLLDTQLNAQLKGAPEWVKALEVDTVVVRASTSQEDTDNGEQPSVESKEQEIIEEDILVAQEKDLPPSEPGAKSGDDASYSSKELIERIYESTREDWEKSPPDVSATDKTAAASRESITEGAITKSQADEPAYGMEGRFTVQVASFKDAQAARNYARELERKGYRVTVTEADIPGKGRWNRVGVGRFLTKEQAREYGKRLKREEPSVKSVFITEIN